MKKQMKTPTSTIRNAFFKGIMVTLFTATSFGVLQAQSVAKSSNAEIKYIGVTGDKLVFEVEYKNDTESSFLLAIKDEDGFELFSSKFKEKNFRKKFAIDRNELGNNSIIFVLASRNNLQQQEFDVNATSRFIEEVSVVKL